MVKRDGFIYVESVWMGKMEEVLEKNWKGLGEVNVEVRASSGPFCVMQNAVSRGERSEAFDGRELTMRILTHIGEEDRKELT